MNLDDLLVRYFGSSDPAGVEPVRLDAGIDRLRVDFGIERDRGRRFALWGLLYMLDAAPELDRAFDRAEDRDAARDFMDATDRAGAA